MAAGLTEPDDLADTVETIGVELDRANQAREIGLAACRRVIRASGSAIRAVHLGLLDDVEVKLDEAQHDLAAAAAAMAEFPAVIHAGFMHDAAKEYVEARATQALVDGRPIPSPADLGVEAPAWLNGLAEAASELRRHALDRLREGRLDVAEALLDRMDAVFGALVTIDVPDALSGGLRRTLDQLRPVIERTRGDITLAVVQQRLGDQLERHPP